MTGTFTALVVEEDAETRKRLAEWLDQTGFVVLTCPGPLPPDYTCHRGEPCPLVRLADVIILDLWLESDLMMEGIPGWQLLSYYQAMKKPIVALVGAEDSFLPMPEDSLVLVRRPPNRDQVISAARSLLGNVPLMPLHDERRIGNLVVLHGRDAREKGAVYARRG